MTEYTVTYFDMAASRGEDVRLALTLAGVPFEDRRLARETFAELKPGLPFAAVPVLEIEGHGSFAQSNAILRLIGRRHGLHPDDMFEAARHDALMDAAEDMRHRISATMRMQDPATRRAAREVLATEWIPQWATCVDRMIGDGPFIGGTGPSVADVKIYMIDRWLSGGVIDDIPTDILDPHAAIKTLAESFRALPSIVEWYAKPR